MGIRLVHVRVITTKHQYIPESQSMRMEHIVESKRTYLCPGNRRVIADITPSWTTVPHI